MFVLFINISSNISSPEIVSLYNIDDMYIDGMLLNLTQIILDFVIYIDNQHSFTNRRDFLDKVEYFPNH